MVPAQAENFKKNGTAKWLVGRETTPGETKEREGKTSERKRLEKAPQKEGGREERPGRPKQGEIQDRGARERIENESLIVNGKVELKERRWSSGWRKVES